MILSYCVHSLTRLTITLNSNRTGSFFVTSGILTFKSSSCKYFQSCSANHTSIVSETVVSSRSIKDRKSIFQGHSSSISSVDQIRHILAALHENKGIGQATHNMYAYRIYIKDMKSWEEGSRDDGEKHGGECILKLLQDLKVENRIVVVSRWFGGIQLGGDRFRHIKQVALEAIELSHSQQCIKEPSSPTSVENSTSFIDGKKSRRKSKFKKIN